MKQRMSMKVYGLVALLLFSACIITKNKMEKQLEYLETLTYAFGDSSVPPPYHRSYTIVVSQDSLVLTVDSYGDTLAEKTYKMPKDGLRQLGAALLKHHIHKRTEKIESEGCTGGTTASIAYTCGAQYEPFYASAYYCGGKTYGTLAGDVDSFLVDLKIFVPDLRAVIRSTE